MAFFPGSFAIVQDGLTLRDDYDHCSFLVKSRRAGIYLICKGTCERRDRFAAQVTEPTSFYRDHLIAWSKDSGRTIDNLETTSDIELGSLAF